MLDFLPPTPYSSNSHAQQPRSRPWPLLWGLSDGRGRVQSLLTSVIMWVTKLGPAPGHRTARGRKSANPKMLIVLLSIPLNKRLSRILAPPDLLNPKPDSKNQHNPNQKQQSISYFVNIHSEIQGLCYSKSGWMRRASLGLHRHTQMTCNRMTAVPVIR